MALQKSNIDLRHSCHFSWEDGMKDDFLNMRSKNPSYSPFPEVSGLLSLHPKVLNRDAIRCKHCLLIVRLQKVDELYFLIHTLQSSSPQDIYEA